MIVFMGTPEFSVPILEMLIENGYPVGLVVTQPDKPVGRKKILTPSPVKKVALKHGIEVFQPVKLKEEYQKILDLKPKLIITAAFGQILPKALLNEIKAINVHGSLLPKYRGGAPIQYSIFNGEKETGITLMEMVYKMDAGDMIDKAVVKIEDEDDYGTLTKKLSIAGRDLLEKNLDDVLRGTYGKQKQMDEEVTFAYTIKYEDEALNFNESLLWNHNRVRGLSPLPGAHFEIGGTTVKVFKTRISDIINIEPNEIRIVNKRLIIGCKDGGLELVEIQQSGKNKLMVKDFLNGQNLFKDGGFING
ncbi:methionyl-tRNA formyltransferase [Acholeplasma hippikon]|uniref:Methionyl-tRNA formyltransferase n=1 Tax=Acholeplasma hippikon TaxID=264636 RepID=A0A449BJP2_9MOLU|nr:methionyl-tRNA formyltransferase [Acholeplasma hippikon]VEU82669.1 methionyl-tRNA formyltransferase [Acholeplasma hippikon]